jgi:hypothetical protein
LTEKLIVAFKWLDTKVSSEPINDTISNKKDSKIQGNEGAEV